MSSLSGVLAGHRAPGAYRWRSNLDVAHVRHTVEQAGWRFAHHDGWTDECRDDVLAGLGVALDFPAHYGRNLDALADCLREVVPADRAGTVLLWDGWGPFARDHERPFALVLRVLAERSERAGGEDVAPFAVLLRGPGPQDAGVPELEVPEAG